MVLAEWGMAGMDALRGHVAVLVVVDVLSFSTAVDVAVSCGAAVFPFPLGKGDAVQAAAKVGAVLAVPRRAAGGHSLSPASLQGVPPGLRLMLPSPNGSRLSWAAGGCAVLAGCLRNAAAVAVAARRMAGGAAVGVVPAGERWPDGSLRPAIEDMLGAGAIIHHLGLPCSPEAQVMRDAFRAAGDGLPALLHGCVSGQELVGRGFAADVAVAAALDVSGTAPVLRDGAYRAA